MRFICIHGHFNQPPGESPWLEAIAIQGWWQIDPGMA